MIYEYAFANESVHVQPKFRDEDLRLLRLQGRQKHQPVISLLMTCHLIQKEATLVFNDFVTYDLTPYHKCMVAVYELGLDVSSLIKAIQIKPHLPENLARQLHLANPASESHRHLLPSSSAFS
jgi:hypothetical protein